MSNYPSGMVFDDQEFDEGQQYSDLCWYCELCGIEVAINDEDEPLPSGWQYKKMRTGIGLCDVVVCDKCSALWAYAG